MIGKGKIQRQQQDTFEQPFGEGQARRKSQAGPLVHGLTAPGKSGADLARSQESAQLIATLGLDLVVLENVKVVRMVAGSRWQLDLPDGLQTIAVQTGQPPPPFDGQVVGCQPEIQNRGLQIIQARVEPPAHDLAIRAAAMVAKLDDAFIDLLAVGQNGPAVSQAPQCLGGEKADRGGDAEASRRASLEPRTQRLRGILDDHQAMASGDGFERLHVGRASIQLRGQDRAGAGRHGSLHGSGVDQMIVPALDRNGCRPGEMNRGRSGHHGMRTKNHFIARADARGAQSE